MKKKSDSRGNKASQGFTDSEQPSLFCIRAKTPHQGYIGRPECRRGEYSIKRKDDYKTVIRRKRRLPQRCGAGACQRDSDQDLGTELLCKNSPYSITAEDCQGSRIRSQETQLRVGKAGVRRSSGRQKEIRINGMK